MEENRMDSLEFQNDRIESVKDYITIFSKHPFDGNPVGDVLDDVMANPGKLIRPRLLLLAAELGSGDKEAEERLCKLAALLELIHIASLIHDDIVDDAPTRRGLTSVQSKYGKDAAVYAGDFLMGRISYHITKENMTRSGMILAKAVEEMCVGEIGQSVCRYRRDMTISEYLKNIRGKTAALFIAACQIGAVESGCDSELTEKLAELGECLGVLFQLRDDLLDFTSDSMTTGKATHRDFQEGIYTMPVLCALEHPGGRDVLQPYMDAAEEGTLTPRIICEMERAVIKLGGVEKTQKEIQRLQTEAEKLVMSVFSPQKALKLRLLAGKLNG